MNRVKGTSCRSVDVKNAGRNLRGIYLPTAYATQISDVDGCSSVSSNCLNNKLT